MNGSDILVFDNNDAGHRGSYVKTIAMAIDGSPRVGRARDHWRLILRTPSVIFPSFEGSPKLVAALAAARAISGKRSAVILLRAHLSEHRSGPNRLLHKMVLGFFDRCSKILPISIVPSETLAANYPSMVFFQDPEFWDLDASRLPQRSTPLSEEVLAAAAERKILLVTGGLSSTKGIDFLHAIVSAVPDILERFLVVIAGKIETDVVKFSDALSAQGAFICPRRTNDDEFFSLFSIADAAWCCYPATRDMSSGIMGRCAQIGVVPIIREGAVLADMFDGCRPLQLPFGDAEQAAAILMSSSIKKRPPRLVWSEKSQEFRRMVEQFFNPLI